jgi:starvation-inducible DNA-binding protein
MSQELYRTKIDVPANARAALVGLLNARLADAIDLAMQMKQAHWNVKGPSFIALHEMFDRIHGEVQVHVDDIAERITALGGTAEGTAAVAAGKSGLPPYPLDAKSGPEHVDAVGTALATFGKAVRAAIDEAGEIGDADTEDLFTGISRAIDKNLWFVEAHAQAAA